MVIEIQKMDMLNYYKRRLTMTNKKVISFIFSFFFITCIASTQENSIDMFNILYDKYMNSEYETVLLSQQGEGAGMFIFDKNKKLSENSFFQVELFSSMGQTQYFIFKKKDENIWYFQKKYFSMNLPLNQKMRRFEIFILNTLIIYHMFLTNAQKNLIFKQIHMGFKQ